MTPTNRRIIITMLAAGTLALTACGTSSSNQNATTTASTTPGGSTPTAAGQVLPVTTNPIINTATAATLHLDSVLVENNVDPATGNDADDHLEIALSNTGTAPLNGFEIFYTITDPSTGDTESYYTALPASFTIDAGTTRTVHFDQTGATDHFPDNQYSLYHTSMNALDVTVQASATDAAPQTLTVHKDQGGEEVAD